MRQHQPADPGAQRVAQVEGRDVQARSQVGACRAGLLQHAHLHRRHGGEGHGAQQHHVGHRHAGLAERPAAERQRDQQRADAAGQRLHHALVRQPAAQQVAGRQTGTEQQQRGGDPAVAHVRDLAQQRLDVGVEREHAGKAEHRDAQAQPDLRAAQHGQFLRERRHHRPALIARHEGGQNRQRRHADQRHHPERGAPAPQLADPRTGRHAQQRGQRQAREHQRDGRSALFGRHQARGHHGADAKEGAVREGGEHARAHQPAVARRQRGGGVAGDEDEHQRHQQLLARPVARGDGQQRRAQHHAHRVARDERAGGRDADAQIGPDLREQAHDDEFGGADAKGTGRQRQQGKRHGSSLLFVESPYWEKPEDELCRLAPLLCSEHNGTPVVLHWHRSPCPPVFPWAPTA